MPQQKTLSSINTPHRTPAALASRALRNNATGMLSVSVQPPSFVSVPLARGARILNFLDRGTQLMKKARIATVSLPSLVKSPEKASKWVPWGTAICLGHGLKGGTVKRFVSILTVGILVQSAAIGGTVAISGSGTWNANTLVTDVSAPNATWSFSFDVSSPVADTTPEPVTNASYLLNGTPVVSETLTTVTFYDSGLNAIPFNGA